MYHLTRLISFLTNPIFIIAPIPFILVHYATSDSVYAFKWTFFSLGFLLFVGLFMIYMVRQKVFTDLDVSKRQQRPLLFFVITLISILYLASIYLFHGPRTLYIGILGVLAGITMVSIVNTRIKASLHVATMTAVILSLGIMYDLPTYFGLIIPVIAWARITVKRHSIEETLTGATIGSVLILIMYFVVKYILG